MVLGCDFRHDVLRFGITKSPNLIDPNALAEQFANAARQEVRTDKKTGNLYRAYHSLFDAHDGEQTAFW